MDALLTTIVPWLSLNFGLPANYAHPRIEFATPEKITELYRGHGGRPSVISGADSADPFSVLAVYDTSRHVIYLQRGWTGRTPAESSALVHEMVHHLDTLAGKHFACPEEREQLAYEAQEKWLNLMGRSLQSEFKIDRFTIIAITRCFY